MRELIYDHAIREKITHFIYCTVGFSYLIAIETAFLKLLEELESIIFQFVEFRVKKYKIFFPKSTMHLILSN